MTSLLASLALGQYIKSLLFGVAPADPLTFAVVPALLLFIALAACYSPRGGLAINSEYAAA
jgi:hypothetical protein